MNVAGKVHLNNFTFKVMPRLQIGEHHEETQIARFIVMLCVGVVPSAWN